ncbi:hypothetical protein EKE94_00435 [Mesobaculum littorinae]|uniref:Uncharacterized protein n=1 Tax=Mesobaculum littorinae TaxID=2486419 RepID=A0A438AKK7_9RHOB|nr:hypothetical protein [Mesobaculum littorinae]RVV99199.1 hypothetical protein EKE94_00435 [Mesobaculum littorinae]
MQILETVADDLARKTLDVVARTGDDDIETRMSETLGASSTTLQEAFLTALRIRKAERRGRALLLEALKRVPKTKGDS